MFKLPGDKRTIQAQTICYKLPLIFSLTKIWKQSQCIANNDETKLSKLALICSFFNQNPI